MRRLTIGIATTLALLVASTFCQSALASGGLEGTEAPTFQVKNLMNKGEFDLTPHLGKKVILLDFWSIYCVACMQEMPHLVNLQNKYKDDLLTVGVDLDSFGTKRVRKFVKKLKFKIPYPLVVDKRRKVAGLYSVSVLPTTVIIDKEGIITYYHVGYKAGDEVEIEAQIRKAMGLPD